MTRAVLGHRCRPAFGSVLHQVHRSGVRRLKEDCDAGGCVCQQVGSGLVA